jgi:bacterioferritin-associated ferredoxin
MGRKEMSDPMVLCLKVYDELREVAAQGGTITCEDLGQRVGLPQDSAKCRTELCRMVDAINLHLYHQRLPMLSAVVVTRDNGRPTWGFFDQARRFGIYLGRDHQAFFQEELRKVYDYWSKPQTA